MDAREAAVRNELSLDTNGFVLLRHETKCPHFRDIDTMGRGVIPMDDFKYVLHRYDINMGERQFKNLLRKIGASSSSVSWRAFMDYFKQDIAR